VPAWLGGAAGRGEAGGGAALFVVVCENLVERTPPPRPVDEDLLEDVVEECEEKYGKVSSSRLTRDSAGDVRVWMSFRDAAGVKCLEGMNGRSFGERTVRVRRETREAMEAAANI
jgi:hypothetical protein